MKIIKYGIIGAGTMAREHILNISLIENAEVVALSDPHEASLNQSKDILKTKVPCFKNHQDMIKENLVDVYLISSPNFTHIEILKDVIKTKKHILVEKPLCTNTKDCLEIKKLTKDYPSLFWTAMEYRYMPPVAKFINEIHNKTIGELKTLTIREHRFPFLKKVNNWNRFEKNTGGTLVEKCCHFFDLMRLIAKSKPISVFASGAQDVNHLDEEYDGKKPDIIDNAYVIVNFENGARSLLELCMFAENSNMQEELVATGNKGKIETSVPSNESGKISSNLRIGMRDGETRLETIEVDKKILDAGHHHGSTYYEHLAFLNAIKNNSNPEVSLNDGLIAVAVGEAAEKSIKLKRLVKLEEIID
ncbi:Gfo/Idh/MocA family oxidoreductase [Candidatus Pelagibacter sp.]|nr:Gfo/Idh/MocA family oxidoreductase [Candidatus Pelagibacter sp.]